MWWHLCLIQSSTALFSFYLLEFSSIFIQFIAVHLKWIKMCRSYDHRAQIYNTSSLELFPYLLLCIGFKAMFSTQTGQWGVYSRPAVLSQWQQTLMTYKIERERDVTCTTFKLRLFNSYKRRNKRTKKYHRNISFFCLSVSPSLTTFCETSFN